MTCLGGGVWDERSGGRGLALALLLSAAVPAWA